MRVDLDESRAAALVWTWPICSIDRFRQSIGARSDDALVIAAVERGIPLCVTNVGTFIVPADFAAGLGCDDDMPDAVTTWSAPIAALGALAAELWIPPSQLRALIVDAGLPILRLAGTELVRPRDAVDSILRFRRKVTSASGGARSVAKNVVALQSSDPVEDPERFGDPRVWAATHLVEIDVLAWAARIDPKAFRAFLKKARVSLVKVGQARLCYPADAARAIMAAQDVELPRIDEVGGADER